MESNIASSHPGGLKVLVVIGSLNAESSTRVVLGDIARQLAGRGARIDMVDLLQEPIPLFNPNTSRQAAGYEPLRCRVEQADAFVLGTPDYHGGVSGAMKNFLDHFWHEFAGKLIATVVASHEKGLTVTDQLRTFARQCYAWTLPYGVAFTEKVDVDDRRILTDALRRRVDMMTRDILVYGSLLAAQRRADLAGAECGFMARWRKTQA